MLLHVREATFNACRSFAVKFLRLRVAHPLLQCVQQVLPLAAAETATTLRTRCASLVLRTSKARRRITTITKNTKPLAITHSPIFLRTTSQHRIVWTTICRLLRFPTKLVIFEIMLARFFLRRFCKRVFTIRRIKRNVESLASTAFGLVRERERNLSKNRTLLKLPDSHKTILYSPSPTQPK